MRKILGPLILATCLALGLYLVFILYSTNQTLLAAIFLGVLALFGFVYTTERAYAYRYLFPGLAAVLVFVLFPLIYTISIGFTNYSSKHLLSYERATATLLDETERANTPPYSMTLHADGKEFRLKLERAEGKEAYYTAPLALRSPETLKIDALPLASGAPVLGEPLPLREVIAQQAKLKLLTVVLPNQEALKMSGLREFAPLSKVYAKQPDGSLKKVATGEIITPNFKTGFFEHADGSKLEPGFKVYIGLDNFKHIFSDSAIRGPFLRIFGWTIFFAAATVVTTVSLGMVLAVLLNWEALRFRGVYRTLLFMAYAVPGFISILVFKGLFNNNFGEINLILNALFGIKPAWFSDTGLARTMLLIVNTWLGYPYMMVLCMGLIKAIPADLYEASALAGAGPLTNFFKITLPLIMKPLMPLMLASFAFNFNNYVLVALLTNGRPDYLDATLPAGTTDLLVSYTVRIAFQDSGQHFGLGAAISTLIFILVAAISLINMRMTRINHNQEH
ncbi:MAG: maltose transporter permease MalF [Pseudomonadota bacterium]